MENTLINRRGNQNVQKMQFQIAVRYPGFRRCRPLINRHPVREGKSFPGLLQVLLLPERVSTFMPISKDRSGRVSKQRQRILPDGHCEKRILKRRVQALWLPLLSHITTGSQWEINLIAEEVREDIAVRVAQGSRGRAT